MREPQRDLVIVANRLPVEVSLDDNGDVTWQRAPGGLVSALTSAIGNQPCTWVGYADGPAPAHAGMMRLESVQVDAVSYRGYYSGLCNSSLWPLYHDAIHPARFQQGEFEAFERVNGAFAARIADIAPPNACVWVHDYHLQLVPQMLRQRRPDLRIGFFLHTPFPVTEVFSRLPWRERILEGILGADVIGLQTPGDARHFLDACARIAGREITGAAVRIDDRTALVGAFPVGVDAAEFASAAAAPDAHERVFRLRQELGSPRTLLLGVDRLDYTKGIPHRLRAFADALRQGDLDPSSTAFVQVAVPTRDRLEAYQAEADEVALLVDQINSHYPGSPVIHYVNRSLESEELVTLYMAADVLVCTPLSDGMNLVAKEYVASRTDGSGALVLSEFAGSAQQLVGAMLVNPFDIDALRRAIVGAVGAPDSHGRMLAMRQCVQAEDAHAWANAFLSALVPGDRWCPPASTAADPDGIIAAKRR